MKNRYYIILLIFLSIDIAAFGQINSHFQHYGLTDGLPQRTVMCIIQDKKGFMWLSTWDGLCKFDGYNFTTYKSRVGDVVSMKTNRVDDICEDKYGDIWVHSYNKEIFRFNPRTEEFMAINLPDQAPFSVTKILPMASGKVWLTSETMGTVCVLDSTNATKRFGIETNTLKGNDVKTVFEDTDFNSWILTDNGLTRFTADNNRYETFFSESKNQIEKPAFFTAIEFKDEIWFGANKGRIWRYQKKEAKFKVFETGVASDIISIKEINDNLLCILTSNNGFFVYDKKRAKLKLYNKSNLPESPTDELISCYVDKDENVWLEMNYYGVAKFDFTQEKLRFYTSINPLKMDVFFPPHYLILEDKTGQIWIHPRGGGFSYYDKQLDKLCPFYNDPLSGDWRFSNMLHDACLDVQGNLWLGTRSDGLEKIVFDNDFFKLHFSNTAKEPFSGNEVRSIFQDNNTDIWLGSKDGVIRIYDSEKNYKGFLSENGEIVIKGVPLKGMAYSIFQDKYGDIWIGTKGNGLYVLKADLSKKNLAYVIKQYENDPANLYSISSNNIYSIHEDSNDNIWVGTYGGGLNLFDKKNNRFINHRNDLTKYPIDIGYQVRTVGSDQNGNIYVGTTFGLIVFSSDYKSPDEIDFKIYLRNSNDKNSLGGNDVFKVHTTRKGDVFIGTFGGGLCKIIKRDSQGLPLAFKTYDVSMGLSSDVVLSIVEDNAHKLWLSSEGNLTKFDPQDESCEVFSDVSRIIGKQYFSEALPLCTRSGEIMFGCTKGVLSFVPEEIIKNDYKPYLALIRFRLSNRDTSLKDNIDNIERLELSHKENFFSIEYAALDFVNPQNILYAYRLDGFDRDWIYNQKQRVASYTNLAPGNYVFRVKSTNSNGNWVDNEHVLHIIIRPSFWQTGWANLLYAVLFFLILYVILRSLFLYYRMKDRVILEQEQTEMKTHFFTDISHEIRTPLTMIVSPVENILENKDIPQYVKPQLRLVLKNANRMLNMVNQILDFRKIQKRKLDLQETSIGDYVSDICNNFFKDAGKQGVNLVVNNELGSEKIWIDRDSIEKLIFNLIANAIKYNVSGKRIEINCFKKDKMIALQVKDQGQGMTKDIQNKLFTRFASFNTDKNKPSTGIGLSIVKEVADKHHAKISVESNVNKGSVFTILFPLGLKHFSEDENVNVIYDDSEAKQPAQGLANNNIESIEDEKVKEVTKEDTKSTILIVEDDEDLREFIKAILALHYNVLEAENGKEGYEVALKNSPDFILSDIMMPEANGIEFLRRIKSNYDTSHIPFILLTAKTNLDDKLEGINYGADDYITKPFNVQLLKAKINNIIRQRKSLFSFYTDNKGKAFKSEEKKDHRCNITQQDELFIQKVQSEIEKNIDNSDFFIDDLVATTNISRKVFFNKMKSLTGLAPVEYVREVKIKYAAELLSTQKYMVKEVSYMVGFSDIKYFTQCFKKTYNMTPSQYKSRTEDEKDDECQ